MTLAFIILYGQVYADALVSMDVEMGFEGICRIGEFNPIKITIKSKEQEVQGHLMVEVDGMIYSHPINISKGVKKVYRFSIPIIKANTEIKASISRAKDTIVTMDISPKILVSNSVLVGFLSEASEKLYHIKSIEGILMEKTDFIGVNLNEDLDYSLQELNNFNIIVVDNFIIANLKKDKQQMLMDWTNNGGLLLVGAGKYRHKTLTGILSGLNGRKKTGLGTVVPIKEGLEGNKNIEMIKDIIDSNITAKGLDRIINGSRINEQLQSAQDLQYVADSLFKPDLNYMLSLTAFLILYILLITGAIIWRKGSRGIVLATVFGIIMFFYALIWSGVIQKNKVVCTGISTYEEYGISYSLNNIYPYKEKMLLDLTPHFYSRELTNSKYAIDPVDGRIIYDTKEPHYLFQKGIIKQEKPQIKLKLNEEILRGEIFNPLAVKLYNSFLIVGDTAISIGDIDGGGKIEIKYRLDHNLFNIGNYNYITSISQNAGLNKYHIELLEYYHEQIGEGALNCKLLGFSSGDKKININGKAEKIKELRLNVFPVTLSSESDEVSIPFRLIQPVVKCNKKPLNRIKNEYTLKKGEELELYYVMPINMEPSEITIHTRVEGGMMELEVYNYNEKQWETVTSEKLRGDSLKDFIQDKPLTIKVRGSGRVLIPQITVNGFINLGDELNG
jgi:uncharacterized membrane protein